MHPDFRKLTEFPHGLSAYVTALTDDERFDYVARQVSPRGGTVRGTYCKDHVKIAGKGVLYAEGHILVDEE